MTTSFPILYKYETVSIKNWASVSFLEKSVFTRNIAHAVTEKHHAFPSGVEDADMLMELLEKAPDDSKWLVSVNNEPAGVWYFKDTADSIVIVYYLLPSYKILDSFFSAFFYSLAAVTGKTIYLELDNFPTERVHSFVEDEPSELVSCSSLKNNVEHPHVSTLVDTLKNFYG